jgi:hypothetical protein
VRCSHRHSRCHLTCVLAPRCCTSGCSSCCTQHCQGGTASSSPPPAHLPTGSTTGSSRTWFKNTAREAQSVPHPPPPRHTTLQAAQQAAVARCSKTLPGRLNQSLIPPPPRLHTSLQAVQPAAVTCCIQDCQGGTASSSPPPANLPASSTNGSSRPTNNLLVMHGHNYSHLPLQAAQEAAVNQMLRSVIYTTLPGRHSQLHTLPCTPPCRQKASSSPADVGWRVAVLHVIYDAASEAQPAPHLALHTTLQAESKQKSSRCYVACSCCSCYL